MRSIALKRVCLPKIYTFNSSHFRTFSKVEKYSSVGSTTKTANLESTPKIETLTSPYAVGNYEFNNQVL